MARELPIQNGRLTTDLDANGFKIKNLPPGSGFTQAQADWSQSDSSAVDFIKNKPPTMPPSSHTHSQSDVTGLADALAGKLSKDEVEAGFTEWTVTPSSHNGNPITLVYGSDGWTLEAGGETISALKEADEYATQLEWKGTDSWGEDAEWAGSADLTATRTRLPTMADLATKQDTISDLATIRSGAALGATAYQKPQTGIPSTDMSSEVQASLALADTAVRPAQLPYTLVTTITLGQLQDRAVQKVTLNAASTTLVLPALSDSDKVADFGLDVVNAYEDSGTPAAASFQLDGTLGTDYNLIVPKGETWSDMTALAAGEMAVYYFTLSAFAIDNLPTWEVMKKVVELVPVPTAP